LLLNNIEIKKFYGSQCMRAGGSFAKLVSISNQRAVVKLRSKILLKLHPSCVSSIGSVSGNGRFSKILGKAGVNRHLGKRPGVRGVAKNPVDHPHGGGEGKTSGGRVSVTP
jgi:large subunit ribosomal protein L2